MRLALWLLVTLRVGLALVGVLSFRLQPPTSVGGDWLNLVMRGHDVGTELLSIWQRWDALWYQRIAEHGYSASDGSPHFLPFYPLTVHVVAVLVAGQTVIAELIVSSVAFVVAMWLLYRLARLDLPPLSAQLVVLLVAFFPTGFFLLAPYTESLYLALTLAAFWFARSGRPWLAGVAGLGAALTRLTGIFLVLPLAFEYIRQRDLQHRRPGLHLVAAALPGLGLVALEAYQRFVVGEQLSPMQLSARWGEHIELPWQPLLDAVHFVGATGDPIELFNIICLLGFAVLALAGLRRFPLFYALYTLPYMGFLFCQHLLMSPLASVCRYTLVLFPCFFMLALWLTRRPWLAGSVLIVGLLFQVFLFEYWVHWGFVA